jgi:hypothetical protein
VLVDFDTFNLAELEAFAASLPDAHAWAWGTEGLLYCRACGVGFGASRSRRKRVAVAPGVSRTAPAIEHGR